MFQNPLLGLCATCVLLAPQIAHAANADIVLYATDGTTLHGNWTRVSDATAAGGERLASVDNGWSNTIGPLAAPGAYVDYTFNAPSATRYHVWLRMRATANSKNNDSVFAQFSDAIGLSALRNMRSARRTGSRSTSPRTPAEGASAVGDGETTRTG
jgi:hypothetical protein